MNDMIKAEREKIIGKKTTRILFVMGIILIAAYFFLFQFGYASVFYNYDTGKMDTVSGFAAIEQRKETAAMFDGKLTTDTLALMEKKIEEAKAATAAQDENSAFSALHVYRDQAAMLEYMTEADGKTKSIEEAYPNHSSVILGYCDGWDKMLSSMGSVLSILMCLFVVITLSPVFSEEYSCHTDSVIYAARYGKTKLVTAKIIASLEAVVGIYLLFVLIHAVLYIGIYGVQGWNVSIQSSLHYASSAYPLTFLQMFLISVVLNLLGIVAITIITLFISAKLNAPVTSLIASCVVCFLPVLFDFTESVPLLQKLQEVCPIFMLHMNGVFAAVKTYIGIGQPIMMFLFNLCLVLLFYFLIRNVAGKHQVMG